MRITLDLEPADIERLQAALMRSRRSTECADEPDVIDAAKYALDHLAAATTPSFVRKRLVEVQRLILMLEDEAWALPQPERCEIVETLAYFSDPDDLIPDHIEVIGLLDDSADGADEAARARLAVHQELSDCTVVPSIDALTALRHRGAAPHRMLVLAPALETPLADAAEAVTSGNRIAVA